jgi:LacI family transcriptional regulator
LVGLIVGDIANPFFAEVARGVETALYPRDHLYLLANCDGDATRQLELARRLLERGVDALIVTVPHNPEVLAIREVPVVGIDRCRAAIPWVSVDHVLGGRLATTHLVDAGYKRISLLTADADLTPIEDREKGFALAHQSAGRQVEPDLVMRSADMTFEAARVAARRLVGAGADAVFAINDVMAAGAIAAAEDEGRRVPDDIGVVGYDDTPMAAWPVLRLTSVAQSSTLVGREAGQMVMQLLKHPGMLLPHSILTPRLVVRASSAGPAVAIGR